MGVNLEQVRAPEASKSVMSNTIADSLEPARSSSWTRRTSGSSWSRSRAVSVMAHLPAGVGPSSVAHRKGAPGKGTATP